ADSSRQKILIVRNDKLGDFMLSLPVFKFLKQSLPGCTLHALVPEYTRDIARACDSIDDIIIDPGKQASPYKQWQLVQTIRNQRYDGVITLFSTTRIGWLVLLAGIRYRLAPATKLAQVFYNHRLKQRRSLSEKPEYVYNLDMAIRYLQDQHLDIPAIPGGPYLQFPPERVRESRQDFFDKHAINGDPALVIVHPGSGGSASNLSLDQYARLVRSLNIGHRYHIVITAGPGELEQAKHLGNLIHDISHSIYHSQHGLVSFAVFLQNAALFISGSTGPLHIAGALDVPTAAFYPRRRSATSLRWQTLNSEARRLGFMPPAEAGERDMQSIDIDAAATEIKNKLL
ncbi:MAG: glycosyltransferase family 9 protein, partial [Thiohalophilus sp.]